MGRGRGDFRYDDAFRSEAVSIVVDRKLTLRKAAAEVGVSYEAQRRWIELSGLKAADHTEKSD